MFTKENIIIAFWEIYREKSINKITIKENNNGYGGYIPGKLSEKLTFYTQNYIMKSVDKEEIYGS